MNILNLIDRLLIDWAKPRTRRTIHNALLIVSIVVTVWLTSEGDWRQALVALVAAFYTASNRANTIPGTTPAGFDEDDPEYPAQIAFASSLNPTCCKYQSGHDEDGFGGDAPLPFERPVG